MPSGAEAETSTSTPKPVPGRSPNPAHIHIGRQRRRSGGACRGLGTRQRPAPATPLHEPPARQVAPCPCAEPPARRNGRWRGQCRRSTRHSAASRADAADADLDAAAERRPVAAPWRDFRPPHARVGVRPECNVWPHRAPRRVKPPRRGFSPAWSGRFSPHAHTPTRTRDANAMRRLSPRPPQARESLSAGSRRLDADRDARLDRDVPKATGSVAIGTSALCRHLDSERRTVPCGRRKSQCPEKPKKRLAARCFRVHNRPEPCSPRERWQSPGTASSNPYRNPTGQMGGRRKRGCRPANLRRTTFPARPG